MDKPANPPSIISEDQLAALAHHLHLVAMNAAADLFERETGLARPREGEAAMQLWYRGAAIAASSSLLRAVHQIAAGYDCRTAVSDVIKENRLVLS